MMIIYNSLNYKKSQTITYIYFFISNVYTITLARRTYSSEQKSEFTKSIITFMKDRDGF